MSITAVVVGVFHLLDGEAVIDNGGGHRIGNVVLGGVGAGGDTLGQLRGLIESLDGHGLYILGSDVMLCHQVPDRRRWRDDPSGSRDRA